MLRCPGGGDNVFGKSKERFGSGLFVGAGDASALVVNGAAQVEGFGAHDGTYDRLDGVAVGPNGVVSAAGFDGVQAVVGPDGVYTVSDHGPYSVVTGPDGVHTVYHDGSGGGLIV